MAVPLKLSRCCDTCPFSSRKTELSCTCKMYKCLNKHQLLKQCQYVNWIQYISYTGPEKARYEHVMSSNLLFKKIIMFYLSAISSLILFAECSSIILSRGKFPFIFIVFGIQCNNETKLDCCRSLLVKSHVSLNVCMWRLTILIVVTL
jgi:hypothetical protein